MGNFAVSGGRGTLTITTQGEWPIGVFKVTVNDLSSSIPSMKTASFKIKKGLWQFEFITLHVIKISLLCTVHDNFPYGNFINFIIIIIVV